MLVGDADAVLTVAKGKLMADKLLASGGMTKDKSVMTRKGRTTSSLVSSGSRIRLCVTVKNFSTCAIEVFCFFSNSVSLIKYLLSLFFYSFITVRYIQNLRHWLERYPSFNSL